MKHRTKLMATMLAALAGMALVRPSLAANPFSSNKPKAHGKDDDETSASDEFSVKTKVPLVGEYTQVVGQNFIVLHGAGLVVNLDGTGENPGPSPARTAVLEDMKRRGIKNPNAILKSPNTAIVLITAYLPPLIRKGEHFDVEVRVPGGSKAKSLSGGWLMETYLAEQAIVPGQGTKQGHVYGTAKGSILIAAGHENQSDPGATNLRGRIVAGGTYTFTTDRNLDLYLRNDFRSERNAIRIANAIGARFHEDDRHGQLMPLAQAKTDQRIELKVLSKYRDNYPRYLDVIRKIAFRETEVARQVRLRALKDDLLKPESAHQAALKLEAIGEKSIPALKAGLKSHEVEVRFNAAVALAYLGNASGLDVLAEIAKTEYAFRVYALAAMASLEDPEVHVKLRELMNSDSAETRYGAFRALTTLDANDPFVRGQEIKDQFKLHALATQGPPMVHLTNYKKSEVVLFGGDQRVRTPLAARAGGRILVKADSGSDQVVVSRFEINREDRRKVVSTRMEDIVLAIAEMGASFPDVAQFLSQASSQRNLPGRLEIDALPRAGREYQPAQDAAGGRPKIKKRIGDANTAPNLFLIDGDKASTAPRNSSRRSDDLAKGKTPAGPKSKKADDDSFDSVVQASAEKTGAKKTASADDEFDSDGGAKGDAKKPAAESKSAASNTPANKSNATGKPSPVKQAIYTDESPVEKPPAPKTDSEDPKPVESRWSRFQRFFDFRGGGVSGNTEP